MRFPKDKVNETPWIFALYVFLRILAWGGCLAIWATGMEMKDFSRYYGPMALIGGIACFVVYNGIAEILALYVSRD